MEIIIGKYSGFCGGVRHTITKLDEVLEQKNVLYSLGEIVHNEIVMDKFKNKGLIVRDSIDTIPNNATVIIRAHGEVLNTYLKAQKKKITIIDLTCGKVRLIHDKILKHKDDSFILIIGKKNHPETIAHRSYSDNCFVIEKLEDIELAYNQYLNANLKSVYVVAQTTFNELTFNTFVEKIKNLFYLQKVIVDNTICNATTLRQQEVIDLAKKVDKMLIIGGVNSSNTKELFNIAENYCRNVYLLQTEKDLNSDFFNYNDVIGIEAGASTPNEVVQKIVDTLKVFTKK